MSYNWIHQAGRQVNNNSKTRTKKHFPEVNSKEKFQDMDSPSHIPLKRNRRSDSDSESEGSQLSRKDIELLYTLMIKRPSTQDISQREDNIIQEITKLLKEGANINATESHRGRTVLHIAANKGYQKVVAFLLERGAKTIVDKEGKTPLDIAKGSKVITILETHAQSHSGNTGTIIDSLRAKLQQLEMSNKNIILSNDQLEELNQPDEKGNTLLMREVVAKAKENINLLIKCGADVNYQNPNIKQRAIDLALQDGDYDIVLALLKANSYFPKDFNLESLKQDSSSWKELQDFFLRSNKLHQLIREGKLKEVKDFIANNNILRFYFNSQNQSAVFTAMKNKSFEIYAFLKFIEVDCLDEEKQEIKKVRTELPYHEQENLRNAMILYSFQLENSHILYLVSKSRAQKHINNFQEKIEKLYRALDVIPEVSQILKVVQYAGYLDIIFDFDNDNISEVCPTADKSVMGNTRGMEHRIYIAANLEKSIILGNLAHELTHLAMRMLYENESKPYIKLDIDKAQEFAKIVEGVQKVARNDDPIDIIAKMFTSKKYQANNYVSELIARMPHILAQYGDRGRMFLADYNELTSYYKDYVEKDCKSYIDESFFIQPRNAITLINEAIGEVYNLQEFNIKFQSAIDLDNVFNSHQGKQILLLNSKSTLLSSLSIYQALESRLSYIAANNYLFLKFEHYVTHLNHINKIFYCKVSELLVVKYSKNSNDKKLPEVLNALSSLFEYAPQKRVIFIVDESQIDMFKGVLDSELPNKYFEKLDKNYQFSDLTIGSQEQILDQEVVFQGKKMGFDYIEENIEECINQIMDIQTLADLIEGKEIKVGARPLGVYDLEVYYAKIYQQMSDENLLRIKNDPNTLYVISIIGQSNMETARDRLIRKCSITQKDIGEFSLDATVNHDKTILIKLGIIEDKEFRQLCNNIGNNKRVIYLIDWKDNEFTLNQFYNTRLYISRSFYERVIIKNDIKEYLSSNNLEEKFIFSNVDDKERFVQSFNFDKGQEEKQKNFQRNCANSNLIQILAPEADPQAIFSESIQQDSMKPIHWLKIEKIDDNMKIIFVNSRGPTINIMKYRDTSINNFIDEKEFFDRVNDNEMLIIIDEVGTGKSTILTKLILDRADSNWVMHINLKECTNAIERLHLETSTFDQVINFLLGIKSLGLDEPLAKNLLEYKLEHDTTTKPLMLLFDRFDEIQSNLYKSKVINLLKFLQGKVTILLTARQSEETLFQKHLKTFTYQLKDPTLQEQNLYLEKFWATSLQLILSDEKLSILNHRVNTYSKVLLNKINAISKEKKSHALRVPLMLKLSGGGLLNEIIKFINKNDNLLPYLNIKMLNPYKDYVAEKYNIFLRENYDNTKSPEIIDFVYKTNNELHWKLAIKEIFPHYTKDIEIDNTDNKLTKASNIGIIQRTQEGYYKFSNRALAEYFLATQLIPHLNGQDIARLLTLAVLSGKGSVVMRSLFNEYLDDNVLESEVLKGYGKYISNIDSKEIFCDNCETILHIAIKEGNNNIVNFLLESLKDNKSTLYKFLKSRTMHGLTPLDYTLLYNDDVVTFNKLYDMVTSRNILSKLIYNKTYGNILNIALSRTHKEHFRNLLSKLSKKTISKMLLNSEGQQGNALYWACYGQGDDLRDNNRHISSDAFPIKDDALYQRITELVEELLNTNNKGMIVDLLTPTDKFIALHRAVKMRNYATVTILLKAAKDIGDNVLRKLLFTLNIYQHNALHIAALENDLIMVTKLLEAAKDIADDSAPRVQRKLYEAISVS